MAFNTTICPLLVARYCGLKIHGPVNNMIKWVITILSNRLHYLIIDKNPIKLIKIPPCALRNLVRILALLVYKTHRAQLAPHRETCRIKQSIRSTWYSIHHYLVYMIFIIFSCILSEHILHRHYKSTLVSYIDSV